MTVKNWELGSRSRLRLYAIKPQHNITDANFHQHMMEASVWVFIYVFYSKQLYPFHISIISIQQLQVQSYHPHLPFRIYKSNQRVIYSKTCCTALSKQLLNFYTQLHPSKFNYSAEKNISWLKSLRMLKILSYPSTSYITLLGAKFELQQTN